MSSETFNVLFIIAVVSGFWIAFFSISNGIMEPYRQGYAECKAGMESRYDVKLKP